MITSTTIPTSQLSAISSPSTYNGRSNLTPQCGHIENQGEVRDDLRASKVTTTFLPIERSAPSQFACTPTALATSKKSTCGGMVRLLIPDTLLERRIPTDEDQSMNEALSRQERLHEGSALTEKKPYD